MDKIKCEICGKEYSTKGLGTHIWRSHGEGKNHKSGNKFGFEIWNKGLNKETDDRVKNNSVSLSKTLQTQIKEGNYIPRRMGKEARNKLSISQSLNNKGGKCKWYLVNGQKVQGTWERDLAILMTKLKIDWYKPKVNGDTFIYIKNGKIKNYTPDFYLKEEGFFLELKGYWWGEDKEKMDLVLEQNKILKEKLVVIEKEKFNEILEISEKEEFLKIIAK